MQILGGSHPGRRTSTCRDAKAGARLMCSRKKCPVDQKEQEGGDQRTGMKSKNRDEVKEQDEVKERGQREWYNHIAACRILKEL